MMDIKRLFQIPLIFLLIPLFFLVMLIKIYILQYIIMNRIALLDAAITAVEAVCFLATPLFLFLPWVLYGVIAKWFGLPAVISF